MQVRAGKASPLGVEDLGVWLMVYDFRRRGTGFATPLLEPGSIT